MDIAGRKKEIRKQLLEKRKTIGKTACLSKSREIEKRVLESEAFATAKIIHFYLSDDVEVQTDRLIEETLRLGKRVVVPLFSKMSLSEITDLNPLRFEVDPFGIRSLKKPFYKEVSPEVVDLWMIPGVAYDTIGRRIGRGGGYYDRLLANTSGTVIGLAFEFQILDHLPASSTDRKVDQIMTEDRTIICRGEKP